MALDDAATRRALTFTAVAIVVGTATRVAWAATLLYQRAHTGTPWATPQLPPGPITLSVLEFAGGEHPEGFLFVYPAVLLAVVGAFGIAGRGFEAHISTESDVPLPDSACVYCGNCIGVCPTGALMFKTEYDMREAGTWDESKQNKGDTICAYCGVGCTLTVHAQDNQIVKVTSPLDHDVTRGHLCIKGRFGWQFVGKGTKKRQASD